MQKVIEFEADILQTSKRQEKEILMQLLTPSIRQDNKSLFINVAEEQKYNETNQATAIFWIWRFFHLRGRRIF